jgi:predicted component of viral defense system (DUF524 family)
MNTIEQKSRDHLLKLLDILSLLLKNQVQPLFNDLSLFPSTSQVNLNNLLKSCVMDPGPVLF